MSFLKRKNNNKYKSNTNKKLKSTSSNGNYLNSFDIITNNKDTKVMNAFEKYVTQNTNMENFYQLTKFSGKCMRKIIFFDIYVMYKANKCLLII